MISMSIIKNCQHIYESRQQTYVEINCELIVTFSIIENCQQTSAYAHHMHMTSQYLPAWLPHSNAGGCWLLAGPGLFRRRCSLDWWETNTFGDCWISLNCLDLAVLLTWPTCALRRGRSSDSQLALTVPCVYRCRWDPACLRSQGLAHRMQFCVCGMFCGGLYIILCLNVFPTLEDWQVIHDLLFKMSVYWYMHMKLQWIWDTLSLRHLFVEFPTFECSTDETGSGPECFAAMAMDKNPEPSKSGVCPTKAPNLVG